MTDFQAGLPAREVHAGLLQSLDSLRRAEKNAVLYFREVHRRKLYRELGYSSIHLYASEELHFSKPKTSQFIRLAESLEELPALRQSLAAGEIPWTKARVVAKAATRETEGRWLAEAKRGSRRELERKVELCRAETRSRQKADPAQASLLTLPGNGSGAGGGASPKAVKQALASVDDELPMPLTLRFRPDQRARFEALMEKLHKARSGNSLQAANREELLLVALEELLLKERERSSARKASREDASASHLGGDEFTRVNSASAGAVLSGTGMFTRVNSSSPYQVHVYLCENCGEGRIRTRSGEHRLSEASIERIRCDCRTRLPGEKNRASIPPAQRERILARDRHRCRMKGCGNTAFLEVHHLLPRSTGGGNEPGNLVTLCSACHQLVHERGLRKQDLERLAPAT